MQFVFQGVDCDTDDNSIDRFDNDCIGGFDNNSPVRVDDHHCCGLDRELQLVFGRHPDRSIQRHRRICDEGRARERHRRGRPRLCLLWVISAHSDDAERGAARHRSGSRRRRFRCVALVQRLQVQGPPGVHQRLGSEAYYDGYASLSVLKGTVYLRIAVSPAHTPPSLTDEEHLAAVILPKL
jgi:hypothetical protein